MKDSYNNDYVLCNQFILHTAADDDGGDSKTSFRCVVEREINTSSINHYTFFIIRTFSNNLMFLSFRIQNRLNLNHKLFLYAYKNSSYSKQETWQYMH